MALIQTEASNLKRDTSNMALINNNVKSYETYKKTISEKSRKEHEMNYMKDQIEELKYLLELALNK